MVKLGYGILSNESPGPFPADLLQITIFSNAGGTVEEARPVLENSTIPCILHPLDYYLSETRPQARARTLDVLCGAAARTGPVLILHDETTPWSARLSGPFEHAYEEGLAAVCRISPVSIENAVNTPDILWFWRRFADSITLDIGHLEAAGLDSERFVAELPEDVLEKVDYVHIHRNNGQRQDGPSDHWELVEGCRELRALRRLLDRKDGLAVIVEVIGRDATCRSMELVRKITS